MVNEMIMFVLQVLVIYMAMYGIVDRICKCFEFCHATGEIKDHDKSGNAEK